MTLQWTFIAVFLYIEIGIICLLLLPFISPYRWQRIFKSNLVSKFAAYSHIYFNVFIGILMLLFLDAMREVRKYAGPTSEVDMKHNPEQETLAHMKLFRAQRNLYIAGFALFLWFVIRRLVTLISTQAKLTADCEASQKQAKSATDTAKRLMEEQENKDNLARKEDTDLDAVKREKDLSQALDKAKQELSKTTKAHLLKALSKGKSLEGGPSREIIINCSRAAVLSLFLNFVFELEGTQLDLSTLRKQAEGTNTEYDRLLKEMAGLQEKLKVYEEEGDKKSN